MADVLKDAGDAPLLSIPGAELELLEDGSADLLLPTGEEELSTAEEPIAFDENLVEHLEKEELSAIALIVLEDLQADKTSRKDWEETVTKGIELLGLDFKRQDVPFEGACTATHPLIIENATKFQSKAIAELIPANGPVKTQIIGVATQDKEEQAIRVKTHMNYQIMEQMPEYYDDMERMLFGLPIVGSEFRKVWWDATRQRPVDEFVSFDAFIVNYWATDLERAERYSHIIYKSKDEFERDVQSGRYVDIDTTPSTNAEQSEFSRRVDMAMGMKRPQGPRDGVYCLIEQHRYLKVSLDGETEVSLPYIVTVDYDSQQVVGCYRNWLEEDPLKSKLQYFVHYKFVPGLGFYGLGYIHLIGNLTDSLTTIQRSLVDSGQFATLQGGFKSKNFKITGDNAAISPGEWRDVELGGMDIKDAIMPLPYKEPSATLFNMLQFLSESGQRFADSTEQVVSDSSNYGPVATTMALLEQSTKFFSAIHKRLHKSQKDEFAILARLNHYCLPPAYPFETHGGTQQVLAQDYDGRVDIIPVSDPNVNSQAHRLALAQFQFQVASQAPHLHDMRELLLRVYRAAQVPEPEKLLPMPQQAQPSDPLTDIRMASEGKPIKAFPGQDHDAHIAVKSAFVQDPSLGQNPFMQKVVPLLAANIQEHMVLKFTEQVQGLTQMGMQQAGGQGGPQLEGQIMAEAAKRVLETNKAMAEQGNVSDLEKFLAQVEMMKAQNSAKDLELTEARDIMTAAIRDRELTIREKDLHLKAAIEGTKETNKIFDQELSRDSELTNKVIDSVVKERIADKQLEARKAQAAKKPKGNA